MKNICVKKDKKTNENKLKLLVIFVKSLVEHKNMNYKIKKKIVSKNNNT